METLKIIKGDKTQLELAAMLGVSQPTISDWLSRNKRPRPEQCKRIAELSGKPLADIFLEFYQC
jgi:transcriptional regulator with XRE-family HTH domain